MSYSSEIENLLYELEASTGLKLELKDAGIDEEDAARRLRVMCDALSVGDGHGSDSREGFYRKLLLGKIEGTGTGVDSISAKAERAHIPVQDERSVILVRFDKPYGATERSVLGEWLVAGRDVMVGIDDNDIAIVRSYEEHPTEVQLNEEAEAIAELLASEASASVIVGFDDTCGDIWGLERLYGHCLTAVTSGELFRYFNTNRVIGYRRMELERLVLELPMEACEDYLGDNFGDFDLSELSNEDRATLKVLFENELSVAETARALYIHRNSLVYRLDRFQKMTGLDVRNFSDAIKCKLGLLMFARLSNINS